MILNMLFPLQMIGDGGCPQCIKKKNAMVTSGLVFNRQLHKYTGRTNDPC